MTRTLPSPYIRALGPEYHETWTIINLTDSSNDEIRSTLKTSDVVSYFRFIFDPDPNNAYVTVDWGESYGTWPWPKKDWSTVVFDMDDQRWNTKYAIGLATYGKGAAGRGASDSKRTVSLRIWHEMLHQMGVNSDAMDEADYDMFCSWLKEKSSSEYSYCQGPKDIYNNDTLEEYYTFLMQKYLGILKTFTVNIISYPKNASIEIDMKTLIKAPSINTKEKNLIEKLLEQAKKEKRQG